MTPRMRLLLLAALVLPLLVAGIWMPPLRQGALLLNLLFLAVAIADRIATPSLKWLTVTREVSEVLSVGVRNPVMLHARNGGRNRHRCRTGRRESVARRRLG